jgi:hypothetical protein
VLSFTANEEKTISWVGSGDGAGNGAGSRVNAGAGAVANSAGSGSARTGGDEGEFLSRTITPTDMTNTATPIKIKGTFTLWKLLFSIRQPHYILDDYL